MSTDDFDAMMADLGLADATPPKPPQLQFDKREDQFIHYITVKSPDKYRMLLHFITHEMSKYWHMSDQHNITLLKRTGQDLEQLTDDGYIRVVIDYYLSMSHLPWFLPPKDKNSVGYDALPACNRQVVIDALMDLSDTKKVVERFKS